MIGCGRGLQCVSDGVIMPCRSLLSGSCLSFLPGFSSVRGDFFGLTACEEWGYNGFVHHP